MNAERLLGALVRQALGGSGMARRGTGRRGGSLLGSSGMKGMLGMGALGVAIAAFDHFARQQGATSGRTFTGTPIVPPPPPGSPGRSAPPPPPPPAMAGGQDEALLMVRAMIAAANADHELDDDERARIVRALEESGVGASEKSLLLDELERPLDLATLAARATTPALKRDVYLASAMAIVADTRAEQNYLARLARQLGLHEAQVAELRQLVTAPRGDGAQP